MGHKIGDAVRLRDGSDLRGLLAPFDEATGYVYTAQTDGEQIVVHYPWPIELYTSAIPASEFVPDRPLAAAPF